MNFKQVSTGPPGFPTLPGNEAVEATWAVHTATILSRRDNLLDGSYYEYREYFRRVHEICAVARDRLGRVHKHYSLLVEQGFRAGAVSIFRPPTNG